MYAATVALYHKELGSNPERISKKLLEDILLLNLHDIDFPASYEDYIIFEKLNEHIALNVLYIPHERKTVCGEYVSQHNHTAKKQITLLKITDNNGKWHFLVLPSIPTNDGYLRPIKIFPQLMSGLSSKNYCNFYCYGCFHSFRTESALNKHVELCKDKKFWRIDLPKKGKNFQYHKPGSKSLQMNYMIYSDLESFLIPYQSCDYENAITVELNKHEVPGYSINVVSNHTKKSEQTFFRGKFSVSRFCKEVPEAAKKLFDTKMMPMKKFNKKQQNDYDNATCCYICGKQFGTHKKHRKVWDHGHYTGDYRGAVHPICNLRYSKQVDIPVAFQNGTKYDFKLLITEFAKEFRSEMSCIPLNTDKSMSFSIPIKKVQKYKKCITYNLKSIDSIKFMNESLGILVNNWFKLYECKCINKEDQDIVNVY